MRLNFAVNAFNHEAKRMTTVAKFETFQEAERFAVENSYTSNKQDSDLLGCQTVVFYLGGNRRWISQYKNGRRMHCCHKSLTSVNTKLGHTYTDIKPGLWEKVKDQAA